MYKSPEVLKEMARPDRTPRRNMELGSDKGMKNKKMDSDTYALRKKVIEFIYRAKKLVDGDLPRVDVRITEDDPATFIKSDSRILGVGRMEQNMIWIPEFTLKNGYDLHWVVFHELGHAIFGESHDNHSKLMCPVYKSGLSSSEIDKLFVLYYKKWKANI